MDRTRRSYGEGCVAAHALDLIGDRWALLVVRELMFGPRRFGALRAGLPGVSANVLTQRLAELETAGLVVSIPPGYGLTAAGEGLWPVIRALCHWGAAQPGHDPRLFISPAALMLSMRAMCAHDRAGRYRVAMDLGTDRFQILCDPGSYVVTRDPAATGMVFSGPPNAMAAAVYGPQPLVETAQSLIHFAGDPAEGQGFIDLFRLR